MEEYTYELETSEDVKKSGRWKPIKYTISDSGCWECVSHSTDGWGYIKFGRKDGDKRKTVKLHRAVYEKEVQEIPPGFVVLHSCDNPKCFNPEHLSVGTPGDNMRDRDSKGRQARGERGGTAKLTEEDIRNIRLDSRTLTKIGEAYGVHFSTIGYIKQRKLWKHVE